MNTIVLAGANQNTLAQNGNGVVPNVERTIMKKQEVFYRMEPKKCEGCNREFRNYRGYVVHKISKHKNRLFRGDRYTVKKGDHLYRIAGYRFNNGMRWKELYEVNKEVIKNVDAILPGTILIMP